MADIRQNTAILDDFNRTGPGMGANWTYVDNGVWTQCEITSSNTSIAEAAAGTTSNSRWTGPRSGPYSGDDAEAWGCAIGGNAGGAAWGIGLFKDFGTNSVEGWRFRNAISGASDSDFHMEQFSNGARTIRHTNTAGASNGPMLMLIRISGSDVEGWQTFDLTGATGWSKKVNYPHSGGVSTDLWLCLASSDNSSSQLCGWDYFGGGVQKTMPQIYRWIRASPGIPPA